MQENAQIIATDGELGANVILVDVFEENGREYGTVTLGKLGQDVSDDLASFGGDNQFFEVESLIGNFGVRGIERNVLGAGTVMLEENVIANGIDKGAEAVTLTNAAIGAKRAKNTAKSLLAEVVDDLWRQVTSAKFELEKMRKIDNKMAFRGGISLTETRKIRLVERVKFQHFPRSGGKYSCDGAG